EAAQSKKATAKTPMISISSLGSSPFFWLISVCFCEKGLGFKKKCILAAFKYLYATSAPIRAPA
ncbi:hypothetical protein RZS08_36560, partial [Arthrospira platensis SPKY1]|nr:hypothetical protein [Arthrospira platensis SPKY1]